MFLHLFVEPFFSYLLYLSIQIPLVRKDYLHGSVLAYGTVVIGGLHIHGHCLAGLAGQKAEEEEERCDCHVVCVSNETDFQLSFLWMGLIMDKEHIDGACLSLVSVHVNL